MTIFLFQFLGNLSRRTLSSATATDASVSTASTRRAARWRRKNVNTTGDDSSDAEGTEVSNLINLGLVEFEAGVGHDNVPALECVRGVDGHGEALVARLVLRQEERAVVLDGVAVAVDVL